MSNKIRKPFWISEEALKICESGEALDGSKSRSEFLENAIRFYSANLHMEASQSEIAVVFDKLIDGKLKVTENRIAKLMFKEAVELAKVSNILAFVSDIDDDTLNKLHIKCVNEVKQTHGLVSFEKAYKFQNETSEDI